MSRKIYKGKTQILQRISNVIKALNLTLVFKKKNSKLIHKHHFLNLVVQIIKINKSNVNYFHSLELFAQDSQRLSFV